MNFPQAWSAVALAWLAIYTLYMAGGVARFRPPLSEVRFNLAAALITIGLTIALAVYGVAELAGKFACLALPVFFFVGLVPCVWVGGAVHAFYTVLFYRLGRWVNTFRVGKLRRAVESIDPAAREWALNGFRSLGPAARDDIPAVADAARHGTAEVRIAACHALPALGPDEPDVQSALRDCLRDQDDRVKAAAVLGLARCGRREAGESVSVFGTVRRRGDVLDWDGLEQLCLTQGEAMLGLAGPLMERGRRAEQDGFDQVRDAAAKSLAGLGDGVLNELTDALRSDDVFTRRFAARAFAAGRDTLLFRGGTGGVAMHTLWGAADDADDQVRDLADQALRGYRASLPARRAEADEPPIDIPDPTEGPAR